MSLWIHVLASVYGAPPFFHFFHVGVDSRSCVLFARVENRSTLHGPVSGIHLFSVFVCRPTSTRYWDYSVDDFRKMFRILRLAWCDTGYMFMCQWWRLRNYFAHFHCEVGVCVLRSTCCLHGVRAWTSVVNVHVHALWAIVDAASRSPAKFMIVREG